MKELTETIKQGIGTDLVLVNKFLHQSGGYTQRFKLIGIKEGRIYVQGLSLPQPIDKFIPYLHSLEDLVNPITINGETFVPIYELAKLFHTVKEPAIEAYSDAVEHGFYGAQCTCWNSVKEMRHSYFQMPFGEFITSAEHRIIAKIHEWYFNVFNLPESEFIRVTPENSPYK